MTLDAAIFSLAVVVGALFAWGGWRVRDALFPSRWPKPPRPPEPHRGLPGRPPPLEPPAPFRPAFETPVREPSAADFLLAPGELAAARRDILEDELRVVIALCGGLRHGWRPGEARRLQLAEETLAALLWVATADPRVERVRFTDTPEARRVMAAIKTLKDIA